MTPGEHRTYEVTGRVLAVLSVVVTFLGAWAYCTMTWGFLLGFGLGWLPAAILAAIVGWLVWMFWAVAAVLAFLGAVLLFAQAAHGH